MLSITGGLGIRSSSTRSLTLLTNAARAAGPPLLFGVRLWVSSVSPSTSPSGSSSTTRIGPGQPRRSSVSRARRVAAQGLVPHDRHRGRRGNDRGADRDAFPKTASVSSWASPCGALPARSWRRCCAISRPMRPRWPATRRRSSPATNSVRSGGQWRSVHARRLPRERNRPRHRLRRNCPRRNRFRRCASPAGGQVRRLSAEIAAKGRPPLQPRLAARSSSDNAPVRGDLVRRVIALDPVIDEALGRSRTCAITRPSCRARWAGCLPRSPVGVARSSQRLPRERARRRNAGPSELSQRRCVRGRREPTRPLDRRPTGIARVCDVAMRTYGVPATTPSLRLLRRPGSQACSPASRRCSMGWHCSSPIQLAGPRRRDALRVPDWLPALVNAGALS